MKRTIDNMFILIFFILLFGSIFSIAWFGWPTISSESPNLQESWNRVQESFNLLAEHEFYCHLLLVEGIYSDYVTSEWKEDVIIVLKTEGTIPQETKERINIRLNQLAQKIIDGEIEALEIKPKGYEKECQK